MEVIERLPLVSVVMISWNRKDLLRTALSELGHQSYGRYEVILVDNGSTDGAPEMVIREFPHVRLRSLSQNAGINAYNIAFGLSSGRYIVILDSDSFLEREGIAKIVRKFEKNPMLGALGCKVRYYYSGNTHHWHPSVRVETGPEEGIDAPLFNGCAAAVRRSVVEEVGFYPEEFFLYENERDLCTRVINAGYEVKYFTDIVGYHMVSEQGGPSDRLVFYSTRNLIWYVWKYLPMWIALRRTAAVVAYNGYLALRTTRIRIYLRPVLSALAGLPFILRRRSPVRKEYLSKIVY